MISEVNSVEDDHLAEDYDVGTDGSSVQHNASTSTATPDHSKPKLFKPRSKIKQIAHTARELKSLSSSFKPKEESEHDVYGKHVADQLSKLSPLQAIKAQCSDIKFPVGTHYTVFWETQSHSNDRYWEPIQGLLRD
ncbi:hypothetical protein J6590_027406 [Homalodisca vitripennis]|nr:hypothetical protein J6590_027406 [Homalodisca vitripennis]